MKSDGLLAKSWLGGEIGDTIRGVLRRTGHNLWMTPVNLQVFLVILVSWLVGMARLTATAPILTQIVSNQIVQDRLAISTQPPSQKNVAKCASINLSILAKRPPLSKCHPLILSLGQNT